MVWKSIVIKLINSIFGTNLTVEMLDYLIVLFGMVGKFLPQVIEFIKQIIGVFNGDVSSAVSHMNKVSRQLKSMDRAMARAKLDGFERTLGA